MLIQKENFKSKPTKNWPEKEFFWGCTLTQAVEVKLIGFFLHNFPFVTKYLLPKKKIAFSLHYKPHSLFRLAKCSAF